MVVIFLKNRYGDQRRQIDRAQKIGWVFMLNLVLQVPAHDRRI